jgi:hypothetical protein
MIYEIAVVVKATSYGTSSDMLIVFVEDSMYAAVDNIYDHKRFTGISLNTCK